MLDVEGLTSMPSRWTPTMKGETLVNTVTELVLLGGSVSFIPQNLNRRHHLKSFLARPTVHLS